ncbi:NADPH-dependent FMN reductase [Mucilaginibacter psychrotolerans]|uniref:NAD(P)H-dependent oxidoreductase n=1 Tax=Mucilaginibacter psychrotolerans TaxID=1524096 RepID=A0A4Y8SM02_9SPHI|nr:NADPH-dependent FMN reductase [Mucilaginibacter psychrotolerans]TFF39690.1 NAD(P)H-dependent oxidoreductase [Mucilaginibacter psychrotolerans]
MNSIENKTSPTPTPPSGGRGANIFAISGSLRSGSSNHAILNHIGDLLPADVNYFIYDSLASIPPFDPGLDNEHPPEAVAELRNHLAMADAIIICTPEYAFGVPGQLKNALDWLVGSSSFVDKPVSLITASLGGEACHAAMQLILGALSAKLTPEATLLVQFIRSKINGDGVITDSGTKEQIRKVVEELAKIYEKLS